MDHGGSEDELCFLTLRNTLGNCWTNMKQLKRKPRVWGSFNRFIFSFHYTSHPLLTSWPFGCVAIIHRNFWTLHLCASWDPWSSMVLKKTIRHWSKTRVGIIQFNMNTSIQYKQLRGLSHFRLVGFKKIASFHLTYLDINIRNVNYPNTWNEYQLRWPSKSGRKPTKRWHFERLNLIQLMPANSPKLQTPPLEKRMRKGIWTIDLGKLANDKNLSTHKRAFGISHYLAW